jgi:hypothetical protein
MARTGVWTGRVLDAVGYVLAVVAAVLAAAAALSFPLGFGWVGVKYVLFVVGILAFGYATFTLRPTPPWKRGDPADPSQSAVGDSRETRFQAAVQQLPPARFHRLPADDRFPDGVKLFLASLGILATSYVMETVFGVAAATA